MKIIKKITKVESHKILKYCCTELAKMAKDCKVQFEPDTGYMVLVYKHGFRITRNQFNYCMFCGAKISISTRK